MAKRCGRLAVLLAALALFAACGDEESARLSLTILHTNDTHAHILEFDKYGTECDAAESVAGECFGGVARRATMIEEFRASTPRLLFLDAGDQFQGTLFYNAFKGQAARVFMNRLGYDAMCLGNHEFDDGPINLSGFVGSLRFPVLDVNIDVSKEPVLEGLLEPYRIFRVGGQKVGLFGLITEETSFLSQPGPNIVFDNVEDSARTAVAALRAEGVDKIIALSHIGYGRDKEVAAAVEGIDVIVGGHSHTLLSNTDPDAAGPYPTVIESPAGEPVLVVTDYQWGKYLGRLDVTFDSRGAAVAWSGGPILLDSSIAEEPGVLAEAQAMNEDLEPLRKKVVGVAAVGLIGDESVCRFYECNLGDLITDAMVREAKKSGVGIAFLNSGAIRTGIQAGEVTLADVYTVLPFGNTLATMKLRGADLLQALEHGVSRAENPENDGTGRFPQVSGLKYVWDPARPVGQRIVSVEVENEDGSYSPLEDETEYGVATIGYLRQGGDDYVVFRDKAIDPYDFGRVLADIVVDYFEYFGVVAPEIEGRITRAE